MTNPLELDPAQTCAQIETFIKDKAGELQRDGVILGLSGGIDSCLVAYLACRAVGPERVLCMTLPDKHSSAENQRHAKLVADRLRAKHQVEDLTSKLNKFGIYRVVPGKVPSSLVQRIFRSYMGRLGESSFSAGLLGTKNPLVAKANAFYRIKHRMRMVTLYYHADVKNLMVVGAANKSEFMIGLFIKFGCDNAADVMPIAGLYKTQVRQIAEYLGIPREIIDKPPSADLIPGITDEYVMGLPYDMLDLILFGLEHGWSHEEIVSEYKCGAELVRAVEGWMVNSRYKREAPYFPASVAPCAG